MKCIVTETSPERVNAHPVTNEDGIPHVYATMAEARAELRANGYSYNRANDRYYIKGTEYRAYIIREDSEEYTEIIEQAEQQAAPEEYEDEAATEARASGISPSILTRPRRTSPTPAQTAPRTPRRPASSCAPHGTAASPAACTLQPIPPASSTFTASRNGARTMTALATVALFIIPALCTATIYL